MRKLYYLIILTLCLAGLLCTGCANKSEKAEPAQPTQTKTASRNKVITLYLQPYNDFPEDQILQLLTDVQNCLDTLIPELNFDVRWYENEELPAYCWYPKRSRYRADSILLYQLRTNGDNYVMGVLNEDISVTSDNIEDWGVLGFGLQPGTSSVVSTFRVKPKSMFYKVVVHEFLHNLGLNHCPQNDHTCYMCDADKKPHLNWRSACATRAGKCLWYCQPSKRINNSTFACVDKRKETSHRLQP